MAKYKVEFEMLWWAMKVYGEYAGGGDVKISYNGVLAALNRVAQETEENLGGKLKRKAIRKRLRELAAEYGNESDGFIRHFPGHNIAEQLDKLADEI
jgi:hypothetical protein